MRSIGKAANDNIVPAYGPFPPSARIAKALGSKYYFTGRPCKSGHVVARYSDGSCTQCKAEYREANREKNIADSRAWRRANPEKAAAQGKSERNIQSRAVYYEKTRSKQIAKALAWNRANPEKARESMERWQRANPKYAADRWAKLTPEQKDASRLQVAGWREANREKHNDNSRRWRQDNPEKSAVVDRNKKAKRSGAEGRHSPDDVQTLIRLQNHKCAECKVDLSMTGYHVDHIMPLALGGTNWPWNLQILCPACNMHKHATDPIVFAQRKGRLL